MKYWITSDTHWSHRKMIDEWKIRPEDYEAQINASLALIPPEDVLIHLGDICIGKDSEVHANHIAPLKCKKWLVRGNHDKKSDGWYLSHGWDFVADDVIIKMAHKRILFTHRPQPASAHYDINIHGHLHDGEHRDAEYQAVKHNNMILISLEKMGYKAFLLESLLSKFINPSL